MTDSRLIIVSADCHAGPQHMADYRPFVDPGMMADFDDYVARIDAYEAQFDDAMTAGGAGSPDGEEGLWDMDIRERCLNADGVAAEIIFTQGGLPFGVYPAVPIRDRNLDYRATPAQFAAGCRAYNRWLADFCARDPSRHLGIARVPLPDIAAAVAEVEFAAKAGLRGGVVLPALSPRSDLPYFNDPIYEPFWAACEANGMTLNMHGGAQMTYGSGLEAFALILCETDWFSHRGLSHLIFSGVFERHPKLHLAIAEQRNHWLGPLLQDFDSIYELHRNARLRHVLPRRPSDYFRSNCFIGASFLSRIECDRRGEIGSECFMWGSDYPHMEGAWPHTDESLRWTFGGDVSSAELHAMLGGNAARCYGIDLTALQPIADRIGPTEAALRVPVPLGDLPPLSPAPGRWTWAFRREGAWH
jgi:predicted TIM-barrel fold metal-dependent hydrolase